MWRLKVNIFWRRAAKLGSPKKPIIWVSVVVLVLSAVVWHRNQAALAATTVDTSTSSSPTAYGFQRKTWHDGTRYWSAFHSDADNRIEFWYSADGTSWTENTGARISVDTNDFSIEADSSNAFIVNSNPDGLALNARKACTSTGQAGCSGAGSNLYPHIGFVWGSSTLVVSCGSGCDYDYPVINRDTNSKVRITYRPAAYSIKSKLSTSANDITAYGSEETVDADSANSNKFGSQAALAGGDMYSVWADGTAIEGKKNTAGTWDTDPTPIATGVTGFEHNMQMVSDTTADEAHLTYIDSNDDTVYQKYIDNGDISDASYITDAFGAITDPQALAFKSDGTKVYVLGGADDTVYQYSLGTAWNMSTASYDHVNFKVNSQNLGSTEITFKSDGTKMYMLGTTTNIAVYQYSLSTAWDLSTASYDSVSFSVASQGTSTNGMAFKTDGAKMYVSNQSNDAVYQYSLSTAWDLSTASYDSVSFSVSSQDTSPSSIAFKSDGTKMYLLGNANDTVYQYSLSTAWNMSTASYDSVSFSVTTQESNPLGLTFKSDGTKMYIVGQTNQTAYQYSLGTAWNMSTASYDSISFSVAPQETIPTGMAIKSDGTKMYLVGSANDTVYQYSLSTAWDLSTASYDSVSFSVTAQDNLPTDLAFKSDGTKMYIVGQTNDTVYQYSLSTAWNMSTASYDSVSFSVASQEGTPTDIAFKSDGTKMYMGGNVNDTVYQYSLSTAWNMSTASYDSVSFSVASQDTVLQGLTFNSNGTKMFVLGTSSDEVHQYSLSTAWNLSTANYDGVSFDVGAQAPFAVDVFFKPGDGQFFIYDQTKDTVQAYNSGFGWQTPVILDSGTGNDTPTITKRATNSDLYVFWERGDDIFYKKGVSPYASANWDTSATTLESTGTNAHLSSAYVGGTCKIPLIWTEGTGSPYNVKFDGATYNEAPAAPTLSAPAAGATGASLLPQFQLRTTDECNDYLRYEIVVYQSDCSTAVRTIDQTGSQTGWIDQDQQTNTAYTGNSVITSSTLAKHNYQTTALSPGTVYCWKARAIDPGGTNTWGSYSATQTFTTSYVPGAPTLVQPTNGGTAVSRTPEFRLKTTDTDNDYLKYRFVICSDNNTTNCAWGGGSVIRSIDQTSSQTNWASQSQAGGTAYASGQTAVYNYTFTDLAANTTYYWRAYAIDPVGTNTWSSASGISSFATETTAQINDINIGGGTTIYGGTTFSP